MVDDLARGRPRVERDTPLGRVRGFERRGAQTFLGLPYARAAGRFLAAVPITPWEGTRDAATYAPACPQRLFEGIEGGLPRRGAYDEDCLYLNVHTPTLQSRPLPVIVWIHGGGFLYGSANECDGTALAITADAVVVSINYRLGLLGWVDLSELGPEYAESGDAWLTDQVMALQWVQDNIAAFGGDPDNVTIVGESAGAAAVLALCGISRTRGLFHRAVAASPPFFAHEPRPDLLASVAKKRRTSRDRAREWVLSAPAEELAALGFCDVSPMLTTGPVLCAPIEVEIAARGADAVPVITGFTSHEGDFFLSALTGWRFRGPLGQVVLRLIARSMHAASAGSAAAAPGYIRRLRAHYGVGGRSFVEHLFRDIFRRSSITAALATTDAGSRGYLYELDVPCRFNGVPLRSAHTADIPLTFNTFNDPEAWIGYAFLDFDAAPQLAQQWVAMLARFCRDGDPAGPLGPWPAYDAAERRSLLVTTTGGEVQADRDGDHRRAVWAET